MGTEAGSPVGEKKRAVEAVDKWHRGRAAHFSFRPGYTLILVHRSFRNCRLPSSMRSIASWAINPTAKRTTDPKLPPPPAWTGSGSLLVSVRSLLLFQSQMQSVAHIQGENTMPRRYRELISKVTARCHLPLPHWVRSDGCQEMASTRGTSRGSHSSLSPLLILQEETFAPSHGLSWKS